MSKIKLTDIVESLLTTVSAFCSGKPDNDEVIAGAIAARAYTMNEANCVAKATVSGTGTFDIDKDGVAVGTITFTASTTGVVDITSGAITAGQNITVTAGADTTGFPENISILLRA